MCLILVLSLGLNGVAQYQPTITNSKEWLVKTCEFGNCLYDYYYFVSDTTIGSHSYKVLDGYHYNQNFYLREDVQQKQVFMIVNDGTPFPQEYLLYDYDMRVGDSIYVRNPISPVSAIEGYYYLDSIIQQSFEQINRNVFYLHGWDIQNNYHETKWIEGIGSTGLINTPGVIGDTAAMAELLCVSENVQKIYSRKPNDTCYSNPTLSNVANNLEVFAPAMHYDYAGKTLHLQGHHLQGKIIVWDYTGKLIGDFNNLHDNNTLDLHFLNEGIYLVKWYDGVRSEVLKIKVF